MNIKHGLLAAYLTLSAAISAHAAECRDPQTGALVTCQNATDGGERLSDAQLDQMVPKKADSTLPFVIFAVGLVVVVAGVGVVLAKLLKSRPVDLEGAAHAAGRATRAVEQKAGRLKDAFEQGRSAE